MKKLLLLPLILFSLTAKSQIGEMIWYKDTVIQWQIDSTAMYGEYDSISQPPNYLRMNYFYISPDSIIQCQFILTDSLGNWILPAKDLMRNNWSSSGTVLRMKGDSIMVSKTSMQIRDSLYLPSVKTTFGANNVH